MVQELTGKSQFTTMVPGITADLLNQHFAAILTNPTYQAPAPKHTAAPYPNEDLSEWQVNPRLRALDRLKPTATGLDELPAWYLRQAAPDFSKPIAELFNLPLVTSTVSCQWMQARTRPVPKVINVTLRPGDY